MFTYQNGIKLNNQPLWLDATRIVENACVSHGHSDHIKKHRHIYATPATSSFVRRRLGRVKITEVEFGKPFSVGHAQITFLPAGHILGSAQIFVEKDGQSLLYTGDFNTQQSLTAEPVQIHECDTLIMECTFGYQKYRFPPRDELIGRLCDFAMKTLANGEIPLVFGYALGKAQEAMKILADSGFRLCAHGSILHLAEVYKKYGIDFGDVVKFNASNAADNRVIVLPPQARKNRQVQRLERTRSVFLSGWGMDASARFRYGVDEVIPLSDHADFDGLLEYIRLVNPKKIYTTHGPKDYYIYLRSLGYDAYPLKQAKQEELF
ncbi:MAG: MBL fold metallo-hydrolase [bacterium]